MYFRLNIHTNGVTGTQVDKGLQGAGVAPANLTFTEGIAFDYSFHPVGFNAVHTFTINNTGAFDATNVGISGLGNPFTFIGGVYPGGAGTCTNTIPAGASCTVEIVYIPFQIGFDNLAINLNFFNGTSSQVSPIALAGEGVAPAKLDFLEQPTYDYGVRPLGSTNEFTFTLTNSGSQATGISANLLASSFRYKGVGGFPGDDGDCTSVLAGNTSCSVVIVYTPTVLGSESDIITVNYVDGVGPQTTSVNLRGTAVNTAQIDISKVDTFDFGNLALNGITHHTFTLTNSGGFQALGITELSLGADFRFLGGSFPGDNGNCTTGLGASNTCRIVVEFNPQSLGLINGNIQIDYDNGTAAVSSVRLISGTGVNPANLSILGASPVNFGAVPIGGSVDLTLTVSNTGNFDSSAMGGTGLTLPFQFAGGSYPGTGGTCAVVLPFSTTCDIVVNYSPTVVGANVDQIELTYFDGTVT